MLSIQQWRDLLLRAHASLLHLALLHPSTIAARPPTLPPSLLYKHHGCLCLPPHHLSVPPQMACLFSYLLVRRGQVRHCTFSRLKMHCTPLQEGRTQFNMPGIPAACISTLPAFILSTLKHSCITIRTLDALRILQFKHGGHRDSSSLSFISAGMALSCIPDTAHQHAQLFTLDAPLAPDATTWRTYATHGRTAAACHTADLLQRPHRLRAQAHGATLAAARACHCCTTPHSAPPLRCHAPSHPAPTPYRVPDGGFACLALVAMFADTA